MKSPAVYAQKAEECLEYSESESPEYDDPNTRYWLAKAQVYATLAVAANPSHQRRLQGGW